MHEMDIGNLPVAVSISTLGKSGYKPTQYTDCDIPVTACSWGIKSAISGYGLNGFLASDCTVWSDTLHRLLQNSDLRSRKGRAGRQKVERDYSLRVWGTRVVQMLRDVADRGKSH